MKGSSGTEFAAILFTKEEDTALFSLVWERVMKRLMNEKVMPMYMTEERVAQKDGREDVYRNYFPIINSIRLSGGYDLESRSGPLIFLQKKGGNYGEENYEEAYNSLVKAFNDEWVKTGKKPIDWGRYDSHKYMA